MSFPDHIMQRVTDISITTDMQGLFIVNYAYHYGGTFHDVYQSTDIYKNKKDVVQRVADLLENLV
jgi:hypothetical protein